MIALFFRDLKLSVRAGGGAMIGVLFFMTVVSVIPFGVGPDLNLLARIGPAILWIGALLASLLGLDRLGPDDDPGDEAVHRRDVPATLGRRVVRGEPELELLEREGATAPLGCHAAAFRSAPARSASEAPRSRSSSCSAAPITTPCATGATP